MADSFSHLHQFRFHLGKSAPSRNKAPRAKTHLRRFSRSKHLAAGRIQILVVHHKKLEPSFAKPCLCFAKPSSSCIAEAFLKNCLMTRFGFHHVPQPIAIQEKKTRTQSTKSSLIPTLLTSSTYTKLTILIKEPIRTISFSLLSTATGARSEYA